MGSELVALKLRSIIAMQYWLVNYISHQLNNQHYDGNSESGLTESMLPIKNPLGHQKLKLSTDYAFQHFTHGI